MGASAAGAPRSFGDRRRPCASRPGAQVRDRGRAHRLRGGRRRRGAAPPRSLTPQRGSRGWEPALGARLGCGAGGKLLVGVVGATNEGSRRHRLEALLTGGTLEGVEL